MKGLKALAVVLAATGLLVSAMPAAAGAKAYKKYVACGITKHAKPKHVCPKKRKKGAFFKSFKRDVRYTICVRFPRTGTRCAKGQEAEKGKLYVNEITSTEPGKHKATWWVKGKKVGTYYFRVES
ncbi:MAG: hypothetical protein R2725_10405 [Solirubrobacterales bacterium]